MHREILSGAGTEKTFRLEKLKLDNGTILIFIMRKYDMKGWILIMWLIHNRVTRALFLTRQWNMAFHNRRNVCWPACNRNSSDVYSGHARLEFRQERLINLYFRVFTHWVRQLPRQCIRWRQITCSTFFSIYNTVSNLPVSAVRIK